MNDQMDTTINKLKTANHDRDQWNRFWHFFPLPFELTYKTFLTTRVIEKNRPTSEKTFDLEYEANDLLWFGANTYSNTKRMQIVWKWVDAQFAQAVAQRITHVSRSGCFLEKRYHRTLSHRNDMTTISTRLSHLFPAWSMCQSYVNVCCCFSFFSSFFVIMRINFT